MLFAVCAALPPSPSARLRQRMLELPLWAAGVRLCLCFLVKWSCTCARMAFCKDQTKSLPVSIRSMIDAEAEGAARPSLLLWPQKSGDCVCQRSDFCHTRLSASCANVAANSGERWKTSCLLSFFSAHIVAIVRNINKAHLRMQEDIGVLGELSEWQSDSSLRPSEL